MTQPAATQQSLWDKKNISESLFSQSEHSPHLIYFISLHCYSSTAASFKRNSYLTYVCECVPNIALIDPAIRTCSEPLYIRTSMIP